MNTEVDIFEHIYFRIAGETISLLTDFTEDSQNVGAHVLSLLSIREKRDKVKSLICDALYDIINATEEQWKKQQLLNFKRDIFNGRNKKYNRANCIRPNNYTQAKLSKYLHQYSE